MSEAHFEPIDIPDIDLDRVHMIGIGGAGMSGIARILLAQGKTVTGSDMKDSRSLLALRAHGADIAVGHRAENITDAEHLPSVVVTSFAAIPDDNPELQAAKEAGILIVRRSDVLAHLMKDQRAFLLAGTHGKTSTTSMSVVALQAAGYDPSFAIGGQLNKAGTNAHNGSDDIFVAEADESDASFLSYRPEVAVVTNIEPDHLDFYGDATRYTAVFDAFAQCVKAGGALVVCVDDAGAAALGRRVLEQQKDRDTDAQIRIIGYGSRESFLLCPGIEQGAVLHSIEVTPAGDSLARVSFFGDELTTVKVNIPGRHMVLNALGAVVGGHLLGAPVKDLIAGVADFEGVRRRFEHYGTLTSGPLEGVAVYDDYAHHPTEVKVVLSAAKNKVKATGQGRVIAIFQPHLYSRTIAFASEFAEALSLADEVFVLDIYGARELPVEGVDSRILTDQMTVPAHFVAQFNEVVDEVKDVVQPHDIVLTIGAGTVTMLAGELLQAFSDVE